MGGDLGRLGGIRAQCLADGGEGGARRVTIEGDLSAQEVVRVEPAEDQIGVGRGGLGATFAVADWSGIGAGATGTDLQQSTLVDPGDAAAAGPSVATSTQVTEMGMPKPIWNSLR